MGKKKSVVKGIKESECVESYGQTENKEIENNILKQQIKNFADKYSQQFIIKIELKDITRDSSLIERISVK